MAIKTITICDRHGEACKAKPEDVQTHKFYDIVTGDPYEIDTCPPEWAKYEKASTDFQKEARKVTVAVVPSTSNGQSAQAAERALWKPLIDAAKEWHKETFGETPRGQLTHKGEKVQQFLKSAAGKAWADWEPGKHIPE